METHMKKAYILLSVLLLAAVGCNRESIPAAQDSAKKLTITAGASQMTRSHFNTDGYSLLWDATDQLSLYCLYVGNFQDMYARALEFQEMGVRSQQQEEQIVHCLQLASVESLANHISSTVKDELTIDAADVGKANARFTTEREVEDWFGVANPTEDDMFFMAAIYPAPDPARPMGTYKYTQINEKTEDMGTLKNLDVFYVPLEIPAVQDGRSYWKYQIMIGGPDEGLIGGPEEDAISYSSLIANPHLHISEMTPLTTMLAFTMQLAPGAEMESCEISKLTIRVEIEQSPLLGYQYGISYVAGVLPFFPNWDEYYEIRLWNRCSPPEVLGNNRAVKIDLGSWDVMSEATSTLTLQFDEPVTVGKDAATAETFYAVMAPTNNPVEADIDDVAHSTLAHPRYTFTAFNAAGEEVLFARAVTASHWGLLEGHKYGFNLLLKEDYENLVLESEAGQYITEIW